MLCYHAASDAWRHPLALGPAAIVRQVDALLRRGYRPATAAEVVPGRGRLLHVTFDDAYTSIERVLPELERRGVPATVFVCSGYAERGAPLAVPELTEEAAKTPAELETMAWPQLRGLAARGVEIGSHTVSHPRLPELSDDELARELQESREQIEGELDRPCPLLAYPYGEYDGRVRQAARSAGYTAAFALRSREWRFDPYAIPRVHLLRGDGVVKATLKTVALVRRPARALRAGVGERS